MRRLVLDNMRCRFRIKNFSGFPVVDEILTQVEKAVKGEEVAKVTTSAPPFDMGNLFIILIAIGLYLYGKPLIQEWLSRYFLIDLYKKL